MLKRGLPFALAAVLAFPALSGAATTLMPGVTYERQERTIGGKPVIVHVVRAPLQGSLYSLRPVLSLGTALGRQTVPSMQWRIAGRATTVAVNGDLFTLASGLSSGVFLRDGVLSARPNVRRSALAITFAESLLVDKFRLVGSWRAGVSPAHPLEELNRPLTRPPGVGLFTPTWGGPTPRVRGAVEIVLTGFPKALLNGFLTGTVSAVRRNGGTLVPPGGAVLQARGNARATMLAEASVGTEVTVRLQMVGFPDDAADALGGGPLLVQGGIPVRQPDEGFSPYHLLRRHPRTAVGQLADGRVLLVVVDGRSRRSAGLTNWGLAQVMTDLGAVTAMGLDGGGSSTLSMDGRVLNTPSDGSPRAVANSLMLFYYGIYAPRTTGPILSPNGDGFGDTKVVTAKVVRRSSVDLRLLRPDGSVAWRYQDVVEPGVIRRTVGASAMPEGLWRWVVEATEAASGAQSRMERIFRVNRTLGFLRLSRERMRVAPGQGGRLSASVVLTRRARLVVSVLTANGQVRRVLFRGELGPGRHAWQWDGRNAGGRVVEGGTYAIRVTATNGLGSVSLRDTVRVLRMAR